MSKVSSALASLGLSAHQISNRTGLPLDRVTQILDGAEPRLSELRALSVGLRVPKHFFSARRQSGLRGDLNLQFRSTRGSERTFNITVDKVSSFVESALAILPKRAERPSLVGVEDRELNRATAEQLSAAYRKYLLGADHTSPAHDLPNAFARSAGTVLALIRESSFEAVSLVAENYLFIFISPRFQGRMLFSLAHELGHAAAGDLRNGKVLFEGATQIGNFSKSTKSERFCDYFAGNFLLPRDAVLKFISVTRSQLEIPVTAPLGDIEILLLARFYGVSFEVAANRCEDLELLPKGGAISLAEHLKKNHKSPEKRAEELGLPSRTPIEFPIISSNLANAIHRNVASGEVSLGWASEQFDVSISQIMALTANERY
jgi:Zn-dependent peptidase ImmA (M78 family)